MKGTMVYNAAHFSATPPAYFHDQLRDYSLNFARDKEAGTRLVISHYVSHAVTQAKAHFGLPNLVSFPEYHIGPEDIPNVGWIHGILDFAISSVVIEDNDSLGN